MLQDSDLHLSIGLALAVLSILPLMSGWVEERLSWLGALMLLVGAALTGYAFYQHDGGYSLNEIPFAIYHTLAHYLF